MMGAGLTMGVQMERIAEDQGGDVVLRSGHAGIADVEGGKAINDFFGTTKHVSGHGREGAGIWHLVWHENQHCSHEQSVAAKHISLDG